MSTLTDDEVSFYEALAEDGAVIKSQRLRKGRLDLIFRLKTPPIPIVTPCNSPNSDCCLTDNDMMGLAGAFGELSRRQRERLAGWGL